MPLDFAVPRLRRDARGSYHYTGNYRKLAGDVYNSCGFHSASYTPRITRRRVCTTARLQWALLTYGRILWPRSRRFKRRFARRIVVASYKREKLFPSANAIFFNQFRVVT